MSSQRHGLQLPLPSPCCQLTDLLDQVCCAGLSFLLGHHYEAGGADNTAKDLPLYVWEPFSALLPHQSTMDPLIASLPLRARMGPHQGESLRDAAAPALELGVLQENASLQ